MRRIVLVLVGAVATVAALRGQGRAENAGVSLDGYAEWKKPGTLIVDGQRVVADASTRWKGKFASIGAVPAGHEVRVAGTRLASGDVLAREIDVRPNGNALFESDVVKGTNELEGVWLKNRGAFEADAKGKKVQIGEIEEAGSRVNRV